MKRHDFALIWSLALAIITVAHPEARTSGDQGPKNAAQRAARPSEVSIRNTRKRDFVSRVNGHRYQIDVALPFTTAPAKGYRVLYVLDGYGCFASATEIARNLSTRIVVVGIGYPDDSVYAESVLARRGPMPSYLAGLPLWQSIPLLEREYDLTVPATDAVLAAETLRGLPPDKSENVGGSDDFLKTIEVEVKPRVADLVPIDSTKQALFGHSLGGLAVLHALFVEPNAFRTYIIASPSIWWSNRKVLSDEEGFAAVVRAGKASPRVLVTMGSLEDTPVKLPADWGVDPKSNDAWYRTARMIENAGDLVERLKALHGSPGYEVADYAVFEKEQHSESAWSALARGIPFAFDDEKQ